MQELARKIQQRIGTYIHFGGHSNTSKVDYKTHMHAYADMHQIPSVQLFVVTIHPK